jgi:hypothetical protein
VIINKILFLNGLSLPIGQTILCQLAIFLFLAVFSISAEAATQITEVFTDSQGRTALYRYSTKPEWNLETPRGLLIYFHGNNSATQEEVLDGRFGSVEFYAFKRELIPVAIASPETRVDGVTRQWVDEDKLLVLICIEY